MVGNGSGRAVETFSVFLIGAVALSIVSVGLAVLVFMEDGFLRVVAQEEGGSLTMALVIGVLVSGWFSWRYVWNGSRWNPCPVDRLGRDELQSLLWRLRMRVPCGHEDADGVCADNACVADVVDRAFLWESSRRREGSLGSRLRAVRRAAGERGPPVGSAGK